MPLILFYIQCFKLNHFQIRVLFFCRFTTISKQKIQIYVNEQKRKTNADYWLKYVNMYQFDFNPYLQKTNLYTYFNSLCISVLFNVILYNFTKGIIVSANKYYLKNEKSFTFYTNIFPDITNKIRHYYKLIKSSVSF